ncbi:N-acetylmuramoyl-L-alanine amidase [Lachnospiraceae bacterium XBB1006]|nr:N-acetylmuramoyl-L-alanine amidase [Lachnospiraceae bacterium XBB1006]
MNGLDRRERRRRYQRQQQLKEYGIIAGIALGVLLFLGGVSLLSMRLFGILTASEHSPAKNVEQKSVQTQEVVGDVVETFGKEITVMIDPGHGERVPGCVVGNIMEKDITLAVSLKLRDALEVAGVTVRMTREDDATYPRLKERGPMANRVKADFFISIHCNSYAEDTSIRGFESYYYDEKSSKLSDAMMKAVKDAGIMIQDSKYGNFQVLRDTKMPAVLLEIGYMSNSAELADMCREDYQTQLAEAIVKGLYNYIKK